MAAPPQGSNFGIILVLKTPKKGRPPCQKQGAAFAFFLRVSRAPALARRCGPKFRQGRQPFSGAGATKKWPLSKRPLILSRVVNLDYEFLFINTSLFVYSFTLRY